MDETSPVPPLSENDRLEKFGTRQRSRRWARVGRHPVSQFHDIAAGYSAGAVAGRRSNRGCIAPRRLCRLASCTTVHSRSRMQMCVFSNDTSKPGIVSRTFQAPNSL